MLNTQALHAQILAVMPDIRRTVAKVLRSSRYYTEDHIDECMSCIMVQIFDYGVRTFNEGKGNVRSHFTSLAYKRALNWLDAAHRRFDVDDTHMPVMTAEGNPHLSLVRAQEADRIRAAFASLEPHQQALLKAYERTECWYEAGREIGVSPATAHRMKVEIAELLR